MKETAPRRERVPERTNARAARWLLGRRRVVGRAERRQNTEAGLEGRLGRWLEALEVIRRALPGLGEALAAA